MSFNSFSNTVWRSWFARVSLSSSPVSRHQILVVIHTSALCRIHHLDCQSMYGSHESFCKWLACLRHTFQEVQTHKHLVRVCLPTSRNVKLFERRAKLMRSLRATYLPCVVSHVATNQTKLRCHVTFAVGCSGLTQRTLTETGALATRRMDTPTLRRSTLLQSEYISGGFAVLKWCVFSTKGNKPDHTSWCAHEHVSQRFRELPGLARTSVFFM